MIVSRSNHCFKCGVRSNSCFIVYENGYKCFSCGISSYKSAEHYVYRPVALETTKKSFHLPPNTLDINKFSPTVLKWLYSYYVYDELILNSRIAYSAAKENYAESIILPVSFDEENNVVEYQRRFFPKAFFSSSGVKKEIFTCGKGDKLIVVEDYISCLRMRKCAGYVALCLFGTSLSELLCTYIINNYTSVSIWLDNDVNEDGTNPGRTASLKIERQLRKAYELNIKLKPMLYQNDISVRQILTENSCKDYSDYEIKNIVTNTSYECGNVNNLSQPCSKEDPRTTFNGRENSAA